MQRIWTLLFFALVAGYCLYYAPYGINETDGGFLTGLAWQVLNGKELYADVVYVRPPLPVWLRALELYLLPEKWAILGERWIFYVKVAGYTWLGAAVLANGTIRWMLAVFGFVVCAHCYPAAAWHTVDGILFGVLSIWCWTKGMFRGSAALSGIFMVACLLCKQSFYPMAVIWVMMVLGRLIPRVSTPPPTPPLKGRRDVEDVEEDTTSPFRGGVGGGVEMRGANRPWVAITAAFATTVLFFTYLYSQNHLPNFLEQTTSAASGNQALQHGVLDYFRIQPVLAGASAILLAPVGWWFWKRKNGVLAIAGWTGWLLVLAGSYAWAITQRQEFTAPFAQARLLFWVALAYGVFQIWQNRWPHRQALAFFALLGLSWCASVSWGYNLPVLFALPGVFVALRITGELTRAVGWQKPGWPSFLFLLLFLGLFRLGYEYVYRDGPRDAMTEQLGAIFPALTGIYSSPETVALYRDLRDLNTRYGPNVKTLPAFPQANFLTRTPPPLPLDWVVEREMGKSRTFAHFTLITAQPVLFIEKNYISRMNSDPELRLTREAVEQGRVVEETRFFQVVRLRNTALPE